MIKKCKKTTEKLFIDDNMETQMNIQVITYNKMGHRFGDAVRAINTFDKAMVFDDFDVNIIDLADPNMWHNKADNFKQLNCNNDLKTLGQLIRAASISKVVILLPKNISLHYCCPSNNYRKVISLKDMLEELRLFVLKDLYLINASFSFGATTTSLGDIQAKSEFYFCNVTPHSIVTSNANGVATTVKNTEDNLYSTFVQLENSEMLFTFLKAIGIESKAYEEAPEWFEAINDK